MSVQPGIPRWCARPDLLRLSGRAGVSRQVEDIRTAKGARGRSRTRFVERFMSGMQENSVVAWRGKATGYPRLAPFSPSEVYPEYIYGETSAEANPVYEAIRGCFHTARLDAANFGLTEWNPLAELIHPGESVLLKPNMVHQRHPRDPEGWRYVITHGSVIRA